METVLDYALKFIKKLQTQDLAYFVVSDEATDDFIEWKDTFMQGMSWTGGCTSWCVTAFYRQFMPTLY